MRYRLYFKNPDWKTAGDCWDTDDVNVRLSCCPADKAEDLVLVKRVSEDQYYLEQLPEEFRAAIKHLAYERGHACGEEEIRGELIDLVGTLAPCFEEYRKKRKIFADPAVQTSYEEVSRANPFDHTQMGRRYYALAKPRNGYFPQGVPAITAPEQTAAAIVEFERAYHEATEDPSLTTLFEVSKNLR